MKESTLYEPGNPEVITRCKNGDDKSFRKLYDLYSKAMFNICMRMLNNRAEAEDALQESFISAFRKINDFDGTGSFGSWLKKIVIHRCIDELRKKRPGFISIDKSDVADEGTADCEEDTEYDIQSLRKAIFDLPDGYRVILTLYLFEDYTHAMIAEKLGIAEGTSKSQYARARKRLQQLMKDQKRKS